MNFQKKNLQISTKLSSITVFNTDVFHEHQITIEWFLKHHVTPKTMASEIFLMISFLFIFHIIKLFLKINQINAALFSIFERDRNRGSLPYCRGIQTVWYALTVRVLPSSPHSPDSVKQTKAFHSGRATRSFQSRKQIIPKGWTPQRLCK